MASIYKATKVLLLDCTLCSNHDSKSLKKFILITHKLLGYSVKWDCPWRKLIHNYIRYFWIGNIFKFPLISCNKMQYKVMFCSQNMEPGTEQCKPYLPHEIMLKTPYQILTQKHTCSKITNTLFLEEGQYWFISCNPNKYKKPARADHVNLNHLIWFHSMKWKIWGRRCFCTVNELFRKSVIYWTLWEGS